VQIARGTVPLKTLPLYAARMDGSITAKKRFPAIPYMVLSKREVKEVLVAFRLYLHGSGSSS